MRTFAESAREGADDASRRALAMAETRPGAKDDEEPQTRAGKSPVSSRSSPGEVTSPTERVEAEMPSWGRRRLVVVAGAVTTATVALLFLQPHFRSPPPAPGKPSKAVPASGAASLPPSGVASVPASGVASVAPPSGRVSKPAVARFGTLNLQSSPWASVSVDGKSVGQTPVVGLRLSAGRHRVTLSNPGLPARTITVVVPSNASVDQRVTLTD
jgi:hypothetical protein